jgi:hypothetical protein
MGSNDEMTRKEFLTLTFTLIGGTVVGGACSSDNNGFDGGFGGTFGNNGGAFGTGGKGGTTGSGGTTGTGGTTGSAGHGGTTGAGGGGGTGATACADPLPETQALSDHTHTVTIHASTLDQATAQTIDTSVALGHMHSVTLEPVALATLKGGGNVIITSSSAGTAITGQHTHAYTISCH